MSVAAIAVFVNGNEPVGARLYNDETHKFKDLSNKDILRYLEKNNVLNLKTHKGQVSWSSGVYSRYPMIYRDGHIENSEKATIIGETTDKQYRIVNYEGRVVTIDNATAIKYGKVKGFTNCKVSNKDNTLFIQSIYGEIPVLEDKLKMTLDENGYLDITLPLTGDNTTLEIPELVGFSRTNEITYVAIKPVNEAAKIRKLILPKNIWYILNSMVINMPNLEEVISYSPKLVIDSGAFSGYKQLKKVYAMGISEIRSRAFANCISLEGVYSKNGIGFIGNNSFYNCQKLDVNKLINTPIMNITSKEAFKKCRAEKISFPKECKLVDLIALKGLQGVHEVRFNSTNTTIQDRSTGEEYPKSDFFAEFSGDVYIMEGTNLAGLNLYTSSMIYKPSEENNWMFNKDTKVHFVKLADVDPNAAKTVAKAQMLGIKTENGELYITEYKDIAIVLGGRPVKEVRDFMVRASNIVFASGNYVSADIKLDKYMIKMASPMGGRAVMNCTDFGECEDGIYYRSPRKTYIIPTKREFVVDYMMNNVSRYTYGYGGSQTVLPVICVKSMGKIDHINYDKENKKVVVTYRNKDRVSYKLTFLGE